MTTQVLPSKSYPHLNLQHVFLRILIIHVLLFNSKYKASSNSRNCQIWSLYGVLQWSLSSADQEHVYIKMGHHFQHGLISYTRQCIKRSDLESISYDTFLCNEQAT